MAAQNISIAAFVVLFRLLIRVRFLGLLRPDELLGLRARDVLISWDSVRNINIAVLGICHPKTSRFMGHSQFTTVDDPGVVSWLACLWLNVPGPYPSWVLELLEGSN